MHPQNAFWQLWSFDVLKMVITFAPFRTDTPLAVGSCALRKCENKY